MAITKSSAVSANIRSVLREKRVFQPPKSFSQRALISSLGQYRKLYDESIRNPAKF
jgi:acetyl-CoA synthetase